MSRILAFDRDDGITAPLHDGEREWDVPVPDARPDEVADLLSRVLEAAGHKVPDQVATEHSASAEYYRNGVLSELSMWRAALARDAAAKERERVEEEAVGAWAGLLSDAFPADWTPVGWTLHDAARALVARGIPAPKGEEAQP